MRFCIPAREIAAHHKNQLHIICVADTQRLLLREMASSDLPDSQDRPGPDPLPVFIVIPDRIRAAFITRLGVRRAQEIQRQILSLFTCPQADNGQEARGTF